jgi:hypothetical protein
MAAQVKSQSTTIALVFNLVLNLGARDRSIACGARMSRAITAKDLLRNHYRQLTVVDELADARPQLGVPELRFSGHEAYPAEGVLNSR